MEIEIRLRKIKISCAGEIDKTIPASAAELR